MALRPVRLVLVASVALLFAPSVASAAWTVPATPNVAGADDTSLNAVACSSANSCMAVGNAVTLTGIRDPLLSATAVERWNGTSWQIVPSPNPPGATFSSLNGISCPRPRVCFAVGSSRTDTLPPPWPAGIPRPLIERWDGRSWSIQPSPDVSAGSLEAVSCSGLLACTAVGSVADQESGYHPLAERWDATGWHVQSIPDAPGSQPGDLDGLWAVSCPRRRTCTAVGRSVSLDASQQPASPLVERWFGRLNAWGLQAAPKPDGADGAAFTGVSCPDGRVCFAVGGFDRSDQGSLTLAEHRVGSRWSVMPTPNPGPYPSVIGPLFNAGLGSVSCAGRRACHAVGLGVGSTGDFLVFGERFDGATWQLESIPVANSGGGPSVLADLSCPSRIFCMAVGHTPTSAIEGTTLAAKWTP
jgi:hypothetical protein